MKKQRIFAGLLSLLFLTGATSLLFAAPFIEPLDEYPNVGENAWEGVGYLTPPELTADIGDAAGKRGIKEIEITATGLGFNCGYMVMLKNEKGDMRMVEGPMGDTFVTDWNGEGSLIFHIDSKMLKDWKHVDVYSQPGCSAAAGNYTEKIASVELR